MSLPTSYMTTTKNVSAILSAIQGAKAPPKFAQSFLEGLGFKNKSDRLIIGVLKSLGFLSDGGEPTKRYFEFLDQSQGDRVLAEAVEDAYSDLFQVDREAQKLPVATVKNKLKTLTQGQYSDAVLQWMSNTFNTLAGLADFESARGLAKKIVTKPDPVNDDEPTDKGRKKVNIDQSERDEIVVQGLNYVINIQLPDSRDPAVYDAIFKSMREHLKGN